MSGLSDILIPYETVEVAPGMGFTVRGLNLADLFAVMREHTPTLVKLFAEFQSKHTPGRQFTEDMVRGMLQETVMEAPGLVFILIASASDEPALVDKVSKLPLRVQLEALEKVIMLSIKTDGELKKLQEVILRVIGGVTSAIQSAADGISTISGGTSEPA